MICHLQLRPFLITVQCGMQSIESWTIRPPSQQMRRMLLHTQIQPTHLFNGTRNLHSANLLDTMVSSLSMRILPSMSFLLRGRSHSLFLLRRCFPPIRHLLRRLLRMFYRRGQTGLCDLYLALQDIAIRQWGPETRDGRGMATLAFRERNGKCSIFKRPSIITLL